MVPDPVAEGPIYGYMGGTGRGGIAGPLGQTLEGGGDVRVWTTTQCYKYLYPKLTTPYRASPSPKIAKNAEPRNVILVSGHVNQAGGGTLDYFCLGKTDLLFQRPTGSQYTVRFLSASGQVLDEFSFDARFQMDLIFDGLKATDTMPFNFVVDAPDGTQTLKLFQGATLLKTFGRSANPPSIQIQRAALQNQMLKADWSVSDPDGDPLRCAVFYSPNAVDRYLVAAELVGTNFTASLDGLPPLGANASVIVRAEDGFNWAEDVLVVNPQMIAVSSSNQVRIAWPAAARGFVLQHASSLSTGSTWVSVTNAPVRIGESWNVAMERAANNQFFRLKRE